MWDYFLTKVFRSVVPTDVQTENVELQLITHLRETTTGDIDHPDTDYSIYIDLNMIYI